MTEQNVPSPLWFPLIFSQATVKIHGSCHLFYTTKRNAALSNDAKTDIKLSGQLTAKSLCGCSLALDSSDNTYTQGYQFVQFVKSVLARLTNSSPGYHSARQGTARLSLHVGHAESKHHLVIKKINELN
jgi:hypothetical protein